ncbi:Calmodulin-sensitive adenylate cyclase [Pandoraea captiosa]|uniref:Calmodulin-sensitive adenylate cyclase n=2 Tax=Pandoraea captiosa TaxID=2508302 RepID=A0A5E5AHX9_9BURK|nr:Calmodulin-sensitive adenylate cyclase [Pandoraea captiosa]
MREDNSAKESMADSMGEATNEATNESADKSTAVAPRVRVDSGYGSDHSTDNRGGDACERRPGIDCRNESDTDKDIDLHAWRLGHPVLDSLRRTMVHASNLRAPHARSRPVSENHDADVAVSMAGACAARAIRTSAAHRNVTSMPLFSESIQRVANLYKVVIGLRRPNSLGQSLLRDGFPTKNFHVKAKSSDKGPTAGFVPIEPKYAKVDVRQWEKQAKSVASALKAGAKAVDLRLSPDRVTELISLGAMTHTGGMRYAAEFPAGRIDFSLASSRQPVGPNGAVALHTLDVLDPDGRPVQVLTNPPELPDGFARDKTLAASALPITADYDLFCLFPRWQRDVDQAPMPVQPHVVAGPKPPSPNLAAQYLRAVAADTIRPEDPNMGNIPLFHRTVVDALNAAVVQDGYQGGKLFWHNAENGNPFSPGFSIADAPIFFVPGQREPLTANSLDDLSRVMGELRDIGYAARLSPRLGVYAR